MYWLLNKEEQEKIRKIIGDLVINLSTIPKSTQEDQLFPFIGRKDRRKAKILVETLTDKSDVVCDPFSGSGVIVYAIAESGRKYLANEYEVYTNRISNAPWCLPNIDELKTAILELKLKFEKKRNYFYKTKCGDCGSIHVLDSLFFDREPLLYYKPTNHERLGENGKNITYRGKYKCPVCKSTSKHFDDHDNLHLQELNKLKHSKIFDINLIENSRINLSRKFTVYGNLFPQRSKLVLEDIWNEIHKLQYDELVIHFMEDVFLSIIPQAKYKDYRSKSQDLHCPGNKLREVNLYNRFEMQFLKRLKRLSEYSFSNSFSLSKLPIKCGDYRNYLNDLEENSIDLVVTDPPWSDGNAYFEKAQLYHPWLDFDLKSDVDRLENEMVVTDAPSRKPTHNMERWWNDVSDIFNFTSKVLKSNKYLALYFRPIPANKWLSNLNILKLKSRMAGYEPLLSIDVKSDDPSMRIQQSAAYVFSEDIIMIFLKLPDTLRRLFYEDHDLDQISYQTAELLQEEKSGVFTYGEWRNKITDLLNDIGAIKYNLPSNETTLHDLFKRYCDEVSPGYFLPKPLTPFSGQLFDTPGIERLFTYVPHIIYELTAGGKTFTYSNFLLSLAQYVENGTRALIGQIESMDIKSMIELYAEPIDGGQNFKLRALPTLPEGIKKIIELDPYDFEAFTGRLLEAQGYTKIVLAGRSGDRGVDIICEDPDGNKVVVQCKRYIKSNVDSTPVQRLHSFAETRGVDRKILITTSDFTPQCKQEANVTGTELINGKELEKLVAKLLPDFII